jgi:hypothetical protein
MVNRNTRELILALAVSFVATVATYAQRGPSGSHRLGAIKNDLSPVLELRELSGVEAYYNAANTLWFHVTTDLQVVEPALRDIASTAFLAGLRAKISL